MDTPLPPAEVPVDDQLVRRLLEAQCPRLAQLPVRLHDEGWDNSTFRVGTEHAVRLPRRAAAVALLLHEQRWLPRVAERLDVAVPAPVHLGAPGPGYPWPWSVVPWIAGSTASEAALGPGQAARLGRFLRALHRPASPDAPANPFRGRPLAERDEFVTSRLALLRSRGLETAPLEAGWRRGVEARRPRRAVWLHGDLHPRNVIVRDGVITGIIDWGDICGGDAATDLASAWTLLAPGQRPAFWSEYPATDVDLPVRALAWAVFFGVALATTEEERHRRMGVAIVDRLGTDAEDDGRG